MFRFAPSQLNLIHDCPRCFWNTHVGGIPRPRGIFPGLPGAIDRLVQKETLKHAGEGKPRWLTPWMSEGVIRPGTKRLVLKGNNYLLTGIYDDLLVMPNKSVIIIDYKTAAQPHSEEATKRYYQLQLDLYALLCEANGIKPTEVGYIVYTTPNLLRRYVEDFNQDHLIDIFFKVTHVPIEVSVERGEDAIIRGLDICMRKEAPAASPDCEYCRYRM